MIDLIRPRRETMAKKDDTPEKSLSVFEEIEEQLTQALAKKKANLEKELEEKIRKEREETQKKIEALDQDLQKEKGTLSDFQSQLSEIENRKADLKKQIKEHIDRAIKFQTQIETLTAQTLEELRTVSTLSQRLEELQLETGEKVTFLKKTLDEKFGIKAEVLEDEVKEETDINLEQELSKLKRIQELLNSNGPVEDFNQTTTPQEPVEEKSTPQPEEEHPVEEEKKEEAVIEVVEQKEPALAEEPKTEPKTEQEAEPETGPEEKPEEKSELKPEEEPEMGQEEKPAEEPEAGPEKKEESVPEEKTEPEEGGEEVSFQTVFEKLEEFRKGNGSENNEEVSYFEKNDKIILDGEFLVSTLNNCFDEAKKLYIKLSQTESPKDQFFIKQEIIKLQESLRKVLLRSIRMCEKDNCALPKYTSEVLNLDVLKSALEKVSMQNWSNQDDFASFDNFAKELKDSFYTRITPPATYLQSIIKELEVS